MKKNSIRKLGSKKETEKIDIKKELTAEIIDIRRKNKEFAATNEHQTYLVLCFSTSEDVKEFLRNINMKPVPGLTLVDGYYVADLFGIEPKSPKFKLKEPLK